MENNRPCIALDADILRSLVEVDSLLTTNKYYDFSTYRDIIIRENIGYLKEFLNMIKNKSIDIFIGNTVFHQVEHIPNVIEFIKKYNFLLPKMNATNFVEVIKRQDELAYKYCFERIKIEEGKPDHPAMNAEYSPYNRKLIPCADAYALSEATVANCIFVTGNGKDFIYYKTNDPNKNSRVKKIVEINKREGYCKEENGLLLIPKPMLFGIIMPILINALNDFFSPEAKKEDMELASNLL